MGRSDFGIYLPLLRLMRKDPGIRPRLLVTGMHLSPWFGQTSQMIEAEGFESEQVEMLVASDTPAAVAKSMALGIAGFAQLFSTAPPELLVVLGDRFEMMAAVIAATPFRIPVAHIHGGEVTRGAIDEVFRHSITKGAHLHFVSTAEYGRRVIQMGEEPWRVTVAGALALDGMPRIRAMDRAEFENRFGFPLDPPPLLVTYHPVTMEYDQAEWQTRELLAALDAAPGRAIVFTFPNADTGGAAVRRLIEAWVTANPRARLMGNFGEAYFSMLAHAGAMVGNSSSGLIEAPSFELPVVNIGSRQEGRARGANVIDCGYGREEIARAIRTALSPAFREELRGKPNPYYRDDAAATILRVLKATKLDSGLVAKRFHDLPAELPL